MLPLGIFYSDTIALSATSSKLWLAIIYIIVFPTVLTYFLNAWALSRVAPSVVAVYIYLQPLIAVILAPVLLPDESWNPRAWFAMLLIFTGLFLVTRQKKRMEIHTTMP
jgi:drug/metabolite transporter (DMT)-like permease